MERQPQNSEFRNNPENVHPCRIHLTLSSQKRKKISAAVIIFTVGDKKQQSM